MEKNNREKKYFVVRERAVPEVLLKVVEAKKPDLDSRQGTDCAGCSRTDRNQSKLLFINIKDDIFPFHEEPRERRSPLLSRWTMNQDFICSTSDHCTFSWKYSPDSSEYSNQWNCNSHSV